MRILAALAVIPALMAMLPACATFAPGALGGEPARRYAVAAHRPGGILGHGDAGLDRPGRDPRRGSRPACRVSLFRRRTCPGPPGDRRRQNDGCTADRRPARCRYPGRTGRRADGGRGPADCAPRLGRGGSFTPDREDRQGGLVMRTGAVVFLLLLMADPIRAADPPPDLKALYEFGPALGAAIPFPEEKRHSAMRLTAFGFGALARSMSAVSRRPPAGGDDGVAFAAVRIGVARRSSDSRFYTAWTHSGHSGHRRHGMGSAQPRHAPVPPNQGHLSRIVNASDRAGIRGTEKQ